MSTADESAPSTLSSQLKSAQGTLYSAISTLSSDPTWSTSGTDLSSEAASELSAAKSAAAGDRVAGKAQSAWGTVKGDQETVTEGNLRAEKAEWKGAVAEGGVPTMSLERVKGKVESAIGMAAGNLKKQEEGNLRAEKAEWTQG